MFAIGECPKVINDEKILAYYIKVTKELLESNNSNDEVLSGLHCPALFVKIGSEVVAIAVYSLPIYREIWLLTAYVNEEYRNKGIFSLLWYTLENVAKEKNIKKIGLGVGADNDVMLRIMYKKGANTEAHFLYKHYTE